MRINPTDARQPRNADQARALDRSKTIMEDARILTQDMVTLGQSSFEGTNLLDTSHRTPRSADDAAYQVEKRASGKRGSDSMEVQGNRYQFESYHSKGILGLGQDRQVFTLQTQNGTDTPDFEKVSLFADGTIDYHLSIDPSGVAF